MSFAAAVALDVFLVLAAGLGAALLCRRASAALRHWILATTVVCATLMPAFELWLPAWQLPFLDAQTAQSSGIVLSSDGPSVTEAPVVAATEPPAPSLAARLTAWAMPVWLTGFAAALLVLAGALVRLRGLGRAARIVDDDAWTRLAADAAAAYGVRRPVLLLHSSHPSLVVTWGVVRPRVLLPLGAAAWPEARLRIVLCHELAHIRRGDWSLQMLGAVLRAAHWFNPLAWLLYSRLRDESEHACDDVVLAGGVAGTEYATHLLEVAREAVRARTGWVPASAVAHPSTLEGRIRAMLNRTTNRAPVSRRIRTAATASMVTLAVVVAAASVSARSDPHTAGDVALAPAAVQSPAVVTQEEFNALLRQMESLETVAADLTIDRARLNAAVTQAVGGLTGTVRDPSGGVLPGVQITLTDRAGQQRTATTDAAGMFRFLELESVEYDLVARLPGFRTLQAPVSVGGDTSQLSLAMQIGALQETITVTGSRTQPDVSSPTRVAASPRPPSAAAGRGVAPRPPATPNVITGVATVGNVTVGGSAGPTLPVRVGGQIKQPTKTLHVNPVYPGELQADGVEGVVILEAVIGPDGKVQDPRVLRSIPGLDQSAVDAVRQWEFTPTLLNNAPVPVVMTVTVQYRLQ